MSQPHIQTISVHEFKKRYDQSPSICLIDVREQDEWQALHIPGATLIPKDTLPEVIEEKVPAHSQPIYLHCRAGVRSLHAANRLLEMGYRELYSIDGGIMAWQQAGYPVESGEDS